MEGLSWYQTGRSSKRWRWGPSPDRVVEVLSFSRSSRLLARVKRPPCLLKVRIEVMLGCRYYRSVSETKERSERRERTVWNVKQK